MEVAPRKELSLFDSTCIIVGIIIGAGIYETAPMVAKCLGSGPGVLGIWLAGGLLALTGALCYAELATTYPQEGGDYVYLTRAYGRWTPGHPVMGPLCSGFTQPGDRPPGWILYRHHPLYGPRGLGVLSRYGSVSFHS